MSVNSVAPIFVQFGLQQQKRRGSLLEGEKDLCGVVKAVPRIVSVAMKLTSTAVLPKTRMLAVCGMRNSHGSNLPAAPLPLVLPLNRPAIHGLLSDSSD